MRHQQQRDMLKTLITEQKKNKSSGNQHDAVIKASAYGALLAIGMVSAFTLKDASDILGVSENTLRKRIEEGKLKRVDGLISGNEILRYLDLDIKF